MNAFKNGELEAYGREAKEKWGDTPEYREYKQKTAGYSKDKRNALIAEMNAVIAEFSLCMSDGEEPGSPRVHELVKRLQDHITGSCYHCSNAVLSGLGQMYVADERFRKNIDKNGVGTAEFISQAIKIYCR